MRSSGRNPWGAAQSLLARRTRRVLCVPKVGRNDPCPCGSGKKYKKCCLLKERAGKMAELREERARKGYWDRFWRRFDVAGYRGKTTIFHEYLNGSSLDGEVVFDMLHGLLREARKRRDYKAFKGLVGSLKTKHPGVYDKDAAFYSRFMVENMALKGDFDGLQEVLEPYAKGSEGIDEFFRVIELLMYHSRTDSLIRVMRRAYPGVMRSHEVIPQGKEEFASLLGWFIIFKDLTDGAGCEGVGSEVLEYWGVDKAYLEDFVERLRVRVSRPFKRADFVKGSAGREEAEERLLGLTLEFMAWLQGRGVSYSRALLARTALVEHLLDEEHYSRVGEGGLLLLPLRTALDRHLANYLSPLNNLTYRVAALVEALPWYYEYLHQSGLIEEEEFKREVEAMKPLRDDVVNYFRSSGMEKEIPTAMEGAWRGFERR